MADVDRITARVATRISASVLRAGIREVAGRTRRDRPEITRSPSDRNGDSAARAFGVTRLDLRAARLADLHDRLLEDFGRGALLLLWHLDDVRVHVLAELDRHLVEDDLADPGLEPGRLERGHRRVGFVLAFESGDRDGEKALRPQDRLRSRQIDRGNGDAEGGLDRADGHGKRLVAGRDLARNPRVGESADRGVSLVGRDEDTREDPVPAFFIVDRAAGERRALDRIVGIRSFGDERDAAGWAGRDLFPVLARAAWAPHTIRDYTLDAHPATEPPSSILRRLRCLQGHRHLLLGDRGGDMQRRIVPGSGGVL